MPDAVVEAKTDIDTPVNDEASVQQNTETLFRVTLIEFYGTTHRNVTLQFSDKRGFVRMLDENKVQTIDNINLLWCTKHPFFADEPKIDCDKEKLTDSSDEMEQSSESEKSSSSLLMVAIILSLMGITILLAFGVFLFFDSKPDSK